MTALLLTGGVLATAAPAAAAPRFGASEAATTASGEQEKRTARRDGRRDGDGDDGGDDGSDDGDGGWRFDNLTATTTANVAAIIGADRLHASGVTGRGVGVALIDTGVVPVPGLTSGNVVNGPDLSLESQLPNLRYLDTYGHGTHLAGIIAGNDPATGFRGIAPGSTLTSVKVGAHDGSVDVTQVIAAVDWVVQHRNDDPALPIRVLNLAYGTDGTQSPQVDPLAHAVENAWRAGIVVVAAGGNAGATATVLTNPATNPHILAVGSADVAGTARTRDDTVSDFSSRGNASRGVDLVAPGRSIVSLRNPGAAADLEAPAARVGELHFKGTGTSQAAAVVSGAVALLLQRRPDLTPDQVKGLLTRTADRLGRSDLQAQGAGEIDIAEAARSRMRIRPQRWPVSTGSGTLEGARGSAHLTDGDVVLSGENDLFGAFDTPAWAAASTNQVAWTGGMWMGNAWTGDGYDGSSWTGRTWAGRTWSGRTWSGRTWSDVAWAGRTWSDVAWAGRTWSDVAWAGRTWSDVAWAGRNWSDVAWAAHNWG